MRWKRDLEGYVLIDHSESPGFTDKEAVAAGRSFLVGFGRGKYQSPTYTCYHCQRVVVMNPDRSRVRGYCPKCDHYVCDVCEAERLRTLECTPFMKKIEDMISGKRISLDGP